MNGTLSLRTRTAVTIFVALFLGYAMQAPAAAFLPTTVPPQVTATVGPAVTPEPVQSPTPTPYARPFTTLPGAWMARIKLHRNAPPEIEKVITLAEGRLSVVQPGESRVQILDANGGLLYEQTFHPQFVIGDPPRDVDEIVFIFVLPVIQEARTLIVITPQGEARYEFPGHE